MKTVVFLSFLLAATTALEIRKAEQESQSQKSLISKSCFPWSTDAAVTNLHKNNQKVLVSTTDACQTHMARSKLDDGRKRYYNRAGNLCNMGIPTDRSRAGKEVKVYAPSETPAGIGACQRDKNTAAFYLPQDPSKSAYMFLDSINATWLFTADLGGCDMFIATSTTPENRNRPLLIHSNANDECNPSANLLLKGDEADDIIGNYAPDGYQLRARVHSLRARMQAYWTTYQANHPGVRVYSYNIESASYVQPFYFIGHFTGGTWTFFLKGARNGAVTDITL